MSGNQPPNGPQNFGHQPNQGGMGPGPQQPYPQQGYPPQPPAKKKRTGCLIAAVVVVVAVVALLGSCLSGLNRVASGPNVAPAPGGGATSSETETEAPTEFAVGQPIQIDDVVLTVNSGKEFPPPNEYSKPQPGKAYYIVNLTLENKGSTPISYGMWDYKIEDSDGVQTNSTFVTDVPNPMNSGSLAPGGKLNAVNLVFEVPSEKNSLKLVTQPTIWSNKQVKVKLTD